MLAIDYGILRHPVDLELHARHSMWLHKIVEAEPMASLLKKEGERFHTVEPFTDLEKAKELVCRCITSVEPVL